jgi:hypothetical protein
MIQFHFYILILIQKLNFKEYTKKFFENIILLKSSFLTLFKFFFINKVKLC